MTGATENFKHRGIIPRALNEIFKEKEERSSKNDIVIKLSYYEIYNEIIYDLLSINHDEISIADDKAGVSLRNLSIVTVNDEEEALNNFFEGENRRSVTDHLLNKNSTRSHCVFTIYLSSRSKVESTEKIVCSKLNLVDLAGSERLSKTQTTKDIQKEAMFINKSLTFLEQVIIALGDKKRFFDFLTVGTIFLTDNPN
jgi:kinesin family protein 6/9